VDRLLDLFRNLGNSLELDEILGALDRDLRRLIVYDALCLHLVADGGFVLAYAAGGDMAWQQTCSGEAVMARVCRDRRTLLHAVSGDSGDSQWAVVFPLEHLREDARQTIAILVIQRRGSPFWSGDQHILNVLAPKLAASIDNARKFRRVEQLAEADPSTGLRNVRSLFQRLDAELARARRTQGTLAVFECSVHGFDRSGRLCSRSATRSIFEKVAVKLRESCREYDFTASSGDSLILVLPGFGAEFLEDKREAIRRIVEEAGVSAGLPLFAVVGTAFFPRDGGDAEDLLAETARRVSMTSGEGP
jgi:GGDEF domain-containing protein